MTGRIRVLIVDDSAFARKVLREALGRDPRIEVVGTARDGLEALERTLELVPDVVTLDLTMPNLDGVGVIRALPEDGPRVVVVTTSPADGPSAIAALEGGAVDFVQKPTALATDRLFELSEELREKVIVAASARRPGAARPLSSPSRSLRETPVRAVRKGGIRAVVVGTSTGGPQALTRLIPALPADLPVPVLVALHIPAGYTETLARRLDGAAAVEVIEATHSDMELHAGRVVLARGGEHLGLARRGSQVVAVTDDSIDGAEYCPSVDHLFRSAAREFAGDVLAVVLTGMGNDGLAGARAIREKGGIVLAESASTSIIYGMPRAVSEAGLVTEEVPLDGMAARICSYL